MFKSRFSARNLIAGVALIALLAVLLTLGVAAQDPGNGQAAIGRRRSRRWKKSSFLPAQPTPTEPFSTSATRPTPLRPPSLTWNTVTTPGLPYTAPAAARTIIRRTVCNCPKVPRSPMLRLYFYDMDAENNAVAQLMSYDGQGHLALIDVVQSAGNRLEQCGERCAHLLRRPQCGRSARAVAEFGKHTSDTLRLCGVRIQYEYTLSRTSLPMILNESTRSRSRCTVTPCHPRSRLGSLGSESSQHPGLAGDGWPGLSLFSFDVNLRPEGIVIAPDSSFAALAKLQDRRDARGLCCRLVTVLVFIVQSREEFEEDDRVVKHA